MANRLSFRKDIQGLRAIAVLAVMLFHYNRQLLPGGFVGVDVFFVISGFLITSILINQKEKKTFSFLQVIKSFYVGRIKRIAPAYYILLVIVAIVSVIFLIPKDFKFFKESLNSALYYGSNQYFSGFGDYFAPRSDELPLLHTWSLAVEMQFYLFYPFLILLVKTKWLKKVIFILIFVLFGISSYQLGEGQAQEVYYGLYPRVPEFLLGGSVVLFAEQLKKMQSRWFPVTGLVLVFVSFVFINDKTPFPGLYAIPGVVGAALILANFSNDATARLLSLPIMVWVGAISYSLYLWHWPVLAFIRYINVSYELSYLQSMGYWVGVFFLASLSYYYIEQRFRQKDQLSLTKNFLGYLCLFWLH